MVVTHTLVLATGDVRMSGALIEIGAAMARAEKIELLTVR